MDQIGVQASKKEYKKSNRVEVQKQEQRRQNNGTIFKIALWNQCMREKSREN